MRVLVCGGRDFSGSVDCLALFKIDILIHGGAKGADIRAGAWAFQHGIHTARVDALWDHYGKSAGFKRNSAMSLLGPDLCIAFPGGVGTRMMMDICNRCHIPVWEPYANP